jgi:hypothetical protein
MHASHALELLLVLLGILALGGAVWRAFVRDFAAAIVLLVVGVVILALALG